eukprot:gene275-6690_t
MQINKVENINELVELKRKYIQESTSPLDGMWLSFVKGSNHYSLSSDDKLIGYLCINDEGYILQFYIIPEFQQDSITQFKNILSSENKKLIGEIKGAVVSTAEPKYLSLCFDHFKNSKVYGFMFQKLKKEISPIFDVKEKNKLTLLTKDNFEDVIKFAFDTIQHDENWLRDYYKERIERKEAFACWENDKIFAIGETRGYDDFQVGYADLGVMVCKTKRKQGIATEVVKQLVNITESRNQIPICNYKIWISCTK